MRWIKTVLLFALLVLPAAAQVSSNATRLRNRLICNPFAPTTNQVLTWNGVCWGAAAGGGIASLTDDGTNTTSTHRFLAPNGTGLLPAYSFTNFPSSGIHAATGVLAFDIVGVQVGTLQASGVQFPGYGVTSDTGPLAHGMNIREIGVYGLSTGIGNAATAGLSYLGTAAVGVGNGTAGDFTGTLQAGVRTTDPGCTTTAHIGKQWFDVTTTSTVYKVCLNVAGTLTWVTK